MFKDFSARDHSTKPSSELPRIAALTSIRGIAAWWIAVYHFREYLPLRADNVLLIAASRGFYAVDLFFIMSGFVIYLNYAQLFQVPNRISLRKFAVARFARIYPLHLFMLMLFAANPIALAWFSHLGLTPAQLAGRYNPLDYVLSLVLIQNWGFRDHLTWNIPAWSISTEFAAYLIFPLAAYLTLRWLRSATAAFVAAAAAWAALSIVFWGAGATSLGDDVARLGLPRCVFEFFIGMMLCCIFRRRSPAMAGGQIGLLSGAAAIAIVSLAAGVPDYLGIPAAFALLVIGLAAARGPITTLLALRPLVFLGEISYATYLSHFFIKDWLKFLLAGHDLPAWLLFGLFLAITLLASVALYTWIELPWRRRLRGRARLASPAPAMAADLSRVTQ